MTQPSIVPAGFLSAILLLQFNGIPVQGAERGGEAGDRSATGAAPATSLGNARVRYTVPDKPYVVLKHGGLEVVVVDNRAVDDAMLPGHRSGYHGIALLRHVQQPRNLFVPAYAGLNFEHIHDGTVKPREVLFEPRHAPMELRVLNDRAAELYQAPTPYWGLESCMRYELLDDSIIEVTFECVPRRDTFTNGYMGLFWASYIDHPESLDIHFRGFSEGAGPSAGWLQGVTPAHGTWATHRAQDDQREIAHDPTFPLELPFGFSRLRYTEPWYFGVCRGMAYVQMFRAEDAVRLTQSPSGGGNGCPAWDFQWFLEKPRIGQRYQLVTRAAYMPVKGSGDEASVRDQIARLVEERQPKHGGTKMNPQGLAAAYPGDEDLERDPRVLFVEDFETGTVLELGDRWGNATQPENLSFSPDIPPNSPGSRSLRIMKTGHLFTHTRGVDRMHARFYVKFHPKIGYIHHFVTLWADRTPTPWPKGWAGKKPSGDALFSSGIEPWHDWNKYPPPGVWHFYSYWHEMKPDGVGHYWGNFFDSPQESIEPSRWYCVEAMLQANSKPEASDGEQAFWVDGKLIGHFKGIRWRSSDQLKLNSFWLLDYVSDEVMKQSNEKYPDRVYEVWFDDVVVATDYIGPVQGKPKGGKKVAAPGKSALLTPGLLLPPPGKVVFFENFDKGAGAFRGGEGRDGALACPSKGVDCWRTFSVPVQDSTTVRFQLKPLANVGQVTVLTWPATLKDNARYHIGGLKPGEWRSVEFRAIEARTGWAVDGANLDGAVLNNIKILFEGSPDAHLLLDDFEVTE